MLNVYCMTLFVTFFVSGQLYPFVPAILLYFHLYLVLLKHTLFNYSNHYSCSRTPPYAAPIKTMTTTLKKSEVGSELVRTR